jgi:hypothetical protein
MKRLLIGLLALAALVVAPSAVFTANQSSSTVADGGNSSGYGTGGG